MKKTLLAVLLIIGCATAVPPAASFSCQKAPSKEVLTWHGLVVTNHTPNLFVVPLFSIEVTRTLELWKPALEKEGGLCDPDMVLIGTQVSIVSPPLIHKYKDKDGKVKSRKVSGLITYGKPAKIIILFNADYEKTALGHELGHLLAWRCLDQTGNPELKKLHEKYGVPY